MIGLKTKFRVGYIISRIVSMIDLNFLSLVEQNPNIEIIGFKTARITLILAQCLVLRANEGVKF